MAKKNDTELMNDFNLKYSHLNHNYFLNEIMDNYNDSKYTRLFKEILNANNFDSSNWNALISMQSAIIGFDPKDANLQDVLSKQLKLLKVAIDKNPGLNL